RCPIDRPKMVETTAFGAAFLAGLSAGVYSDWTDAARLRQSERIFEPLMPEAQAAQYHRNWLRAVERARGWAED
ncbi:MAG: glycerol kinase, partial [Oscillospiraceae bacterium]|nr:glycerol kinase [Oscillospiraceae bacterium]